jgi:hypothetical protein
MSEKQREVREEVQVTQPIRSEVSCHCPICGKPVKRVKEMTEEECSLQSDCSNEYYLHKGQTLIKLIGTTPTDGDMKRELSK